MRRSKRFACRSRILQHWLPTDLENASLHFEWVFEDRVGAAPAPKDDKLFDHRSPKPFDPRLFGFTRALRMV